MNVAATETSAADATNPNRNTADNHSESAAAEPAAQSSENALATTATTPTYAHAATAEQNGVTFTVGWDDATAGEPTTFHVTQTGGSANAKARMDVPTYKNTDGPQESVCDPSRNQWTGAESYKTIGDNGYDFTFEFTASGSYNIYFYFMDTANNIGYLRITDVWITVNDPARPSVTQIVNNGVAQCRQETSGSEYDMALRLHDWTLDQLEYDHNLNWCSAESGLTRHQGTCESYQRIYATNLNRPTRRRLWSRGCDGFASSRSYQASPAAFDAGSRCRLPPRSAARGAGPRRSSLLSRRKNKITCRNALTR